MALVDVKGMADQGAGFNNVGALRQVGLLLGLAASVALGFWIVLWAQEPNYSVLYSALSERDSGLVADALSQSNVSFKIEGSGIIMVPSSSVHEARLKLAAQGLPRGAGVTFETLGESSGFSTSQFMEQVRYQQAVSNELGRTISSIANIEHARVHLAIPKQSVFVRDRKKPTASVMLSLYSGRILGDEQIAAIIHLVASAIPGMEANDVTIVDSKGRLLKGRNSSEGVHMSSNQFGYKQKLENSYVQRIVNLLEPMIGIGKVKAQVSAKIDFTVIEETKESYNPDVSVIRSEQTSTEKSGSVSAVTAPPGTLVNQPPGKTTGAGGLVAENTSLQVTRNFELEKTITHTRLPSAILQRLSVAVVMDNKMVAVETGTGRRKKVTFESTALTAQEIADITRLIKEAVGFDESRGDSIEVINTPFITVAEVKPLPAIPLMEQPWLWDLVKQGLGGIAILLILFGVLKPILRDLATRGKEAGEVALKIAQQQAQATLALDSPTSQQLKPPSYDEKIDHARKVINDDPARAAQTVKQWMGSNG